MSSAEDISLSTTSPAASTSGPQIEEFSLERKLEAKPEPGVEPGVEPEEVEAPPSNSKPLLKTHMVAREVRVVASGAPPDKGVGERELFTEETTSILVCENGGVIRLSAAVTPGQLLLLTNVESKSEAVAQVKRKRAYRPTSCFVELEFAEPAHRFWGTEFSAASALLPKDAQEAEAAALVLSAEAVVDEPGEPPAAPSAEEAQAFKREVEGLRQKPTWVEMPDASQQAPAAIPTTVTEGLSPWTPVEAPSPELNTKIGWHEVSTDVFEGKSPRIGRFPDPIELATVGPAHPPEPALNFNVSLLKVKRSLRARGSFTPSFRGGVLRLALLSTALVVTVGGAAWYKHWIPWKSAAKNPAMNVTAPVGNAKTPPSNGSLGPAKDHPEFNNAKMLSDAPVTSPGLPPHTAALVKTAPPELTDAVDPPEQPVASSSSESPTAVKRTVPSETAAGKHSPARPTARTAADSAAPPAAESVAVPPKLIKSVRALASLDALRDFETGNVVIDAVVGTAGEVHFISVISGPPSLRAPAVEALKEYQYEPATRNGQPVPAHVTITIHFRFEP